MKIFAKLVILLMAVSSFGGALASAQSVQAVCASNPYDPNPNCVTTSSTYNNGVTSSNTSNVKYPELCSVLTRTLKVGDQGADVKSLQIVLGQEGIAYLGGTGYYGTLTEKAVKIFQNRAGIYAVGKVGPQTLTRMRQLWCGPGSGNTDNGNGNTGSVVALTITPTNSSTNSLTLTWTTRNAVSCQINNQSVPVNGTQNYSIYQETEYTIACVDSQNRVARKTIVARPISTGGNLPTVNLSINPTNAVVGTYATLYWTSTNASSCSINGQIVQPVGSQQVYVQNTNQSYSITCTNSTGQTVTQNVSSYGNGTGNTNGLQINLSTDKTNYAIGETVNTTLVVQNNSSTQVTYQEPICSLYGPFNLTINGTDFYTFLENSPRAVCLAYGFNPVTLQPYQSKTYNYSAVIANKNFSTGSLNLQANLTSTGSTYAQSGNSYFTINGSGGNNGSANLYANPTNITYSGQPVTLTWNIPNINLNSCSLSSNGNYVIGNQNANASYVVYPTANTNYSITCTNYSGQQITAYAYVTLNGTGGNNGGITITANPTNITYSGQPVTLNWYTAQGTYYNSCSITGGSTYQTNQQTNGALIVYPTTSTNYTITCINSSGQSSSATAYVSINGSNSNYPTVTLTASPSNLTSYGQTSTLNLLGTNLATCLISGGVYSNSSFPMYPNSGTGNSYYGTLTVNPYVTTTYNLNCSGTNGQTISASATVTVNGTTNNNYNLSLVSNNNLSITVNVSSTCTSDMYIVWGDGQTSSCSSGLLTHTYANAGTYNVYLKGNSTYVNGVYTDTYATLIVNVVAGNSGTNVINSFYGVNNSGTVSLNWTGSGSNTCNLYRYTALGPSGEYYYDANKSLLASAQQVNGSYSTSYIATTNQVFELFTLDCGGTKSNTIVYSSTSGGAPTLSITPTTTTVAKGSSATFTIVSNNVASCFNGRLTSGNQLYVLNGQFSLTPDYTTLYNFKCIGTNGSTTYATVNVNVTGSPTFSSVLQANVATTSARSVKLTLNSTNPSCNETTTETGSVDFGDGSRPTYSMSGCYTEINYTYFGAGLYYIRRYVGSTLLGTYNLTVN